MIGFIWIVQIVIVLICTTIMHLFGNCIVLFIFCNWHLYESLQWTWNKSNLILSQWFNLGLSWTLILFSSIKVINESTQNHDDLEWWRTSPAVIIHCTFLCPNYQLNLMWTTHNSLYICQKMQVFEPVEEITHTHRYSMTFSVLWIVLLSPVFIFQIAFLSQSDFKQNASIKTIKEGYKKLILCLNVLPCAIIIVVQ